MKLNRPPLPGGVWDSGRGVGGEATKNGPHTETVFITMLSRYYGVVVSKLKLMKLAAAFALAVLVEASFT